MTLGSKCYLDLVTDLRRPCARALVGEAGLEPQIDFKYSTRSSFSGAVKSSVNVWS